jgi:hypothetical protein
MTTQVVGKDHPAHGTNAFALGVALTLIVTLIAIAIPSTAWLSDRILVLFHGDRPQLLRWTASLFWVFPFLRWWA